MEELSNAVSFCAEQCEAVLQQAQAVSEQMERLFAAEKEVLWMCVFFVAPNIICTIGVRSSLAWGCVATPAAACELSAL